MNMKINEKESRNVGILYIQPHHMSCLWFIGTSIR